MSFPAVPLSRRGVTLVEAVLFISVALGLIVGGLAAQRQAQVTRETQEAMRLLSALATESRMLSRRSGPLDAGTDMATILIAAGAVPDQAVSPVGTLQSPWRGRIWAFGGRPGGGVLQRRARVFDILQIQLDNVPQQVCARLLPFGPDGAGTFADGVAAVLVPGAGFYASRLGDAVPAGASDPTGLPPDEAARACAMAATDGVVPAVNLWLAWSP